MEGEGEEVAAVVRAGDGAGAGAMVRGFRCTDIGLPCKQEENKI